MPWTSAGFPGKSTLYLQDKGETEALAVVLVESELTVKQTTDSARNVKAKVFSGIEHVVIAVDGILDGRKDVVAQLLARDGEEIDKFLPFRVGADV